MICPECRGRGFVAVGGDDGDDETPIGPCPYCDGYTEAEIERSQRRNEAYYRDDRFEPEKCHHCGLEYRGPSIYCCLECSTEEL
jgi:hypothetical protein